ncbi:hypothetical protein VNI00_012590 [Paramarasmius palmivorus]|uniref:Uncharacterized protein n=1 Tax=Paramarasmius palmivorus TaxID=297713 RepID=A0AAW0C525_9AGAR
MHVITRYFDCRPAYASISLAHLNVPRLMTNHNSATALELVLDSHAKENPREYLSLIKYPNQEDDQAAQMTTLIFHYFNNESVDLKVALADHITEHPQILYLAGTVCHQPGEDCDEPQCKVTVANREAWKNRMEESLVFGYRVGFEGCLGGHVKAKGDYIQLNDTGRCLIFFYCPGRGQITVTVSVRYTKAPSPTELKATLKFDVGGTPLTETRDVPAREDGREGELEGVVFSFPNMQRGTGRIMIRRDWGNTWEIYGHVELKWRSSRPV